LAVVWEMIKDDELGAGEKLDLIEGFDSVLGLDLLLDSETEKVTAKVQSLVDKREQLRKEKKFNEADKVREEIEGLGWVVEDGADEVVVRKISN